MLRVISAISEKQSNENIALYAAMIMPHLVLSRTTSEPDATRNKTTTRRLRMWLNGEIGEFFKEAEALQKRTTNQTPTIGETPPAKSCDNTYVVASSENNQPYHPVIFDRIQSGAIRRAGMKTRKPRTLGCGCQRMAALDIQF